MMKHFIIIFIFIFLFIDAKSQNLHKALYKIYYKANNSVSKIDESKLDSRKRKILLNMRKRYKKSFDYANVIDFVLEFDKEKSVFYLPEQLEIEEGTLRILKMIGRFKGEYYTNSEITIQKKNSFGQDFLIDIPKFKWKLSNTSKKIGPFKCFKATTTKNIEGTKGIFKQEIIAWFAPELPFNFGPKEYNGLPGLIVQIEEGNVGFILKKINLIKKKNIEIPKMGKKITQQEFNQLSKIMYESIKK